MTPVPLDLPLRLSEAAELANLVFSLAERMPLKNEIRNRVAARAAVLSLETIRPYPGSLERDPVHHSTYYLAVDGAAGEPLLLHMALGGAPTSGIFSKALLIGRTRLADGRDIVINAVPFGPCDHQNLDKFVAQSGTAFLPRPQGSRTAIAGDDPAAFDTFRDILKATGKNVAALAVPAGSAATDFFYAGLCAAIRAGWRDGYTIGVKVDEATPEIAPFSRFAVDVSALVDPAGEGEARYSEALRAAERRHDLIRQTRSACKIARPFDFELDLAASPVPTTVDDLLLCLNWLKSRGKPAQLTVPAPGADLKELAAAARNCQCLLSLDARHGSPSAIAGATMGHFNYSAAGEDLPAVARQLLD